MFIDAAFGISVIRLPDFFVQVFLFNVKIWELFINY